MLHHLSSKESGNFPLRHALFHKRQSLNIAPRCDRLGAANAVKFPLRLDHSHLPQNGSSIRPLEFVELFSQ